jgi:hypothetical protein
MNDGRMTAGVLGPFGVAMANTWSTNHHTPRIGHGKPERPLEGPSLQTGVRRRKYNLTRRAIGTTNVLPRISCTNCLKKAPREAFPIYIYILGGPFLRSD